jgi:2'-5' RNA ligase
MFVAVWPDEATRQRLASLELRPAEGLRLVKPGQWHVTLRFLGDVDGDLRPRLVDALGVAAEHTGGPVVCTVGPTTAWFSGARVLQLPVAGLEEAAQAVRQATLPVVPETVRGAARFNGHLTIARTSRHHRSAPARDALAGVPFAATFAVGSFELVASQLSAEGPRYTTLARVPLPVIS